MKWVRASERLPEKTVFIKFNEGLWKKIGDGDTVQILLNHSWSDVEWLDETPQPLVEEDELYMKISEMVFEQKFWPYVSPPEGQFEKGIFARELKSKFTINRK